MSTNIKNRRSISRVDPYAASSSQLKGEPLPPECLIRIEGREYRLSAEIVSLGRASENQIVIDHPSVSRQHAQFYVTESGVFIEDLKSRNGIKVKGKRVQRAELRNNDRFEIGDLEGQFFQKHPKTKSSGPTEETAVGLAPRASLVDRFAALPSLQKKIIVGGGVLLFMIVLVQMLGGPTGSQQILEQAQAAIQDNPCAAEKISKQPTSVQAFEACREHEDLGNFRLALACFARMENTREVCEAVQRVKTNQTALADLRFEEGSRALENYYYDLAIVKFQEVLLIADDDSVVRKSARQQLEEAKKKKLIRR